MNRFATFYSAILCCAALIFVDVTSAQVAQYSPKVGEPHPDFILPSIDDGQPIQLSALQGKKVLLMHFASW